MARNQDRDIRLFHTAGLTIANSLDTINSLTNTIAKSAEIADEALNPVLIDVKADTAIARIKAVTKLTEAGYTVDQAGAILGIE